MPKRICVIGDSHTAAIGAGWKAISGEFPEFALTFFAAAGTAINELRVADGTLFAADEKLLASLKLTSKTDGIIEVASYDAIILCGLHLSFTHMLAAQQRLRRAGQLDEDSLRIARLAQSYNVEPVWLLLKRLRKISQTIPIILIPTPVPPLIANEERFARLAETGRSANLKSTWINVCHKFAEEWNAIFLPPPSETVSDDGLTTKAEFATGPARFTKADDSKSTHMNAAYGALALEAALLRIAQSG